MILVVDSGSTKTDWIAINRRGEVLFETQTLGLNPQVLTNHILKERIVNNFELYKFRKDVEEIYFYGAGCGTEPPRVLIKNVFSDIFNNCKEFNSSTKLPSFLNSTIDRSTYRWSPIINKLSNSARLVQSIIPKKKN